MPQLSDAEASELDIVLLIDNSGSMGAPAATRSDRRHDAAREFALGFANWAAKVDDDGIGLGFFGGTIDFTDNVKPDQIADLFGSHEPRGGTPMCKALSAAIQRAESSPKKTLIVVVTDGEPSDGDAGDLAGLIVDMTKRTKDERINILFAQVGNAPEATKVLQFLDDQLTSRGAAYDAVDTKDEGAIFTLSTGELIWGALND